MATVAVDVWDLPALPAADPDPVPDDYQPSDPAGRTVWVENRRARKHHDCDGGCRGEICPGEDYRRTAAPLARTWFIWKECSTCRPNYL